MSILIRERGKMAPVRDPKRPDRILAAATTLFDLHGFHGVTMEQIGEAAGIAASAIYRHFASKEEMLAVVFEQSIDRYMLAAPEMGDDPVDELEKLVRGNLKLTLAQRELATVWMREDRALSDHFLRQLRRRERAYVDRWVDCLRRCFPHRSDADCAAAAMTALETIVALAARRRGVSPREAEITETMVLAGLRTLSEVRSAQSACTRSEPSVH